MGVILDNCFIQHEHLTFANILLLCFDTTFFSVVCSSLGRLNTRAQLHTLFRILFSLKRFATYQIYKTWPSELKMPLFSIDMNVVCLYMHGSTHPWNVCAAAPGRKRAGRRAKRIVWCRNICRLCYIVHQTKYRNKQYYTGSYISHWLCCIFSALIICHSWTTTIDNLKEVETKAWLKSSQKDPKNSSRTII